MSIKPKKINENGKIGIIAPSACLNEENLKYYNDFKPKFEKRFKLELVEGKYLFSKDKYNTSAASPENRAADLNNMFLDKTIDAVWCVQGGSSAIETLRYIDFELIKNNPKIFIGLSNITVLLNAIYKKTNLITYHGTDPKSGHLDWHMESEYSYTQFENTFLKDTNEQSIDPIRERKVIREGSAEGILIGGNLQSLVSLCGTEYFPDLTDKILLLEGFSGNPVIGDVSTYLETLKMQKNFDKLAGILLGQYYAFDVEEIFDRDKKRVYFEDLVLEKTKEFSFPILKSYEFGHRCPSCFLGIGGRITTSLINLKYTINP